MLLCKFLAEADLDFELLPFSLRKENVLLIFELIKLINFKHYNKANVKIKNNNVS